MNQLKYVCISDFHLGAAYSLLTYLDSSTGKIDVTQISPVLKAFGKALHKFIPPLCGENPPVLILLGDILDLSFASSQSSVSAFQRFIEALFPPNQLSLFDKRIFYTPGNHDHLLWTSEKYLHFLAQIKSKKIPSQIPKLLQITPLLKEPEIECHLLSEVIRSYPHLLDYSIRMSYPNFGFKNEDRMILFHHGHFVESMYRMMSEISKSLFGGKIYGNSLEDIERQNGSWIDFFWSSFGDAGKIQTDAVTLYELLQDGAALHQFITKKTGNIEQQILPYLPSSGTTKTQSLTNEGITSFLDLAIGWSAELERNSYLEVLSNSSIEGLKWYLDGPVHTQLQKESPNLDINDVSFIFGHTHKPFEDELAVQNFKFPLKVYNSGGWVLDIARMVPPQGGSMILIDDDLQIASLRMFNDPVNNEIPSVRVNGVGGYSDETNSFLHHLQGYVEKHIAVWDEFSEKVATELEFRARIISDKYFDPKGSGVVKSVI